MEWCSELPSAESSGDSTLCLRVYEEPAELVRIALLALIHTANEFRTEEREVHIDNHAHRVHLLIEIRHDDTEFEIFEIPESDFHESVDYQNDALSRGYDPRLQVSVIRLVFNL